jgi:NAD(P)-dependent dehydrogenase (short-subunit alcohol dehydrogenase family)
MTRAVLTTGANSGIGLACVLELARSGYRSIGSVRSEAKADVVSKAAAEAGVEVETVLLDVTNASACEEVVGAYDLYGLVNNAGYGLTGAVEDIGDDEARALLETMVVAPMRLARLALPAMRAAGQGRIVNISSIMGRTTTPLTGWYQGAKHALEALSDALRIEIASAGVKVVLVEPGGFKTNIWQDLDHDVTHRADSRFADAYRRSQQLTRIGEPLMGDPIRVAKAVERALSARRPRTRYLVGYDAQWLAAVDRVTPTRVKDAVARIALGL